MLAGHDSAMHLLQGGEGGQSVHSSPVRPEAPSTPQDLWAKLALAQDSAKEANAAAEEARAKLHNAQRQVKLCPRCWILGKFSASCKMIHNPCCR